MAKYPDLNPEPSVMQGGQVPSMLVAMIGPGGMPMMGTPITDDDIKFHDETWMVLPKGMTYERACQILKAKQEEEENVVAISRKYLYRPDDGAAAAAHVLKERYGITLGKEMQLPFGMTKPPQLRTVTVGVNKTIQAPWDIVEIPVIKGAEIRLAAIEDEDWGPVFFVSVETPKKHRKEVDALLDALEQHLREHSIYRGKAVVGAGRLDFLDTSKFDPTKICFSDHVNEMLENAVFGAIRNADAFVADGIPLRRAILLHGPYGTGKSSIGLKTAQIAEQNGWTFLMGKTGSDSVKTVLQTAKLYQRCVVFVEDIDVQADENNPQKIAQLLEAFDGVTSKGTEIILVMTTNHVDRIHKGLMRPGRLDFMIEVGALDRSGIEALIRAVVKP
ncbi:MAG: AAA family ATPase, partial [Marmoricola sp.]